MSDFELRDLLERATDRIPAPDLAAPSLATARRVRTRRHGALAGLSVAALVAGVAVVVVGLGSGNGGEPPADPATSPGSPKALVTPTAPSVPDSAAQPFWDPVDVASLPVTQDVALPASLDPNVLSSGPLDDSPMSAAVAVVDTGTLLQLVDSAGEWRTAKYPGEPLEGPSTAISADGTRLGFTARDGVWWRDVQGGEWRRVAYPSGFELVGGARILFAGTEEIQLGGWRGRSWALDLGSGRAESLPYWLSEDTALAPDHTAIEFRTVRDPGPERVVDEWRERTTLSRTTSANLLYVLTRATASDTSIAAAREVGAYNLPRTPAQSDGLIALDRDGLTTRAYLPIRDESAWYARTLDPLAWLDADTVLFSVIPKEEGGYDGGVAHLVTWNVESGDLARVAQLPADLDLALATEILASP